MSAYCNYEVNRQLALIPPTSPLLAKVGPPILKFVWSKVVKLADLRVCNVVIRRTFDAEYTVADFTVSFVNPEPRPYTLISAKLVCRDGSEIELIEEDVFLTDGKRHMVKQDPKMILEWMFGRGIAVEFEPGGTKFVPLPYSSRKVGWFVSWYVFWLKLKAKPWKATEDENGLWIGNEDFSVALNPLALTILANEEIGVTTQDVHGPRSGGFGPNDPKHRKTFDAILEHLLAQHPQWFERVPRHDSFTLRWRESVCRRFQGNSPHTYKRRKVKPRS